MRSKGSAVWKGSFKDGRGSISTASGALREAGYSVNSRFEGGSGTNPEELIAAAHAACFSMALSLLLGNEGITPESIETDATVSLDKAGAGFEISSSHLQVVARIPGADEVTFQRIAKMAEQGCPVSKVLKARISMEARLAS